MEPTTTVGAPTRPEQSPTTGQAETDKSPEAGAGHTRRTFVRGVAAAGASTVGAAALDATGLTHLLGDSASAATGATGPFSEFDALAASSADAFEVPAGYRADVLLRWDDPFANSDGTALKFGFNNDYLAYFPLDGSKEGLLFVNHEYPAPFFEHGNIDPAAKTPGQIAMEQEAVGNSIVHIKKDAQGLWTVVSPSPYNRRITGSTPVCEMTGPLAGNTNTGGLNVGSTANGSVANCSGGITPWGTALSCEENYADYGSTTGFGYGWGGEYVSTTFAKYGWVVETDPYDPSWTPRKHTALGRFRHENTAFRHVPGKKFVLYMGDDRANEGVYKFVSDRQYFPNQRSNNLKILESGTLYIAKWNPEGRRRYSAINGTLLTPTSGTGEWVEVLDDELAETAARLRTRLNNPNPTEFNDHYATNRPEDVEVESDGSVLIAFTNNTGAGVFDVHGLVRRMKEEGNDPTALTFTWADYADGGEKGRPSPGEKGFSSADNLTFDTAENLWVVTDISSSALQGSTSPAPHYAYHGNNAVFMVPKSGPNAGVAFRFANMPVEAEGTGPYFTPNDDTLFIAVQHPGEETPVRPGANRSDPTTHTSWWPAGNKTAGQNPATPRPSVVAITKVPDGGGDSVIPPPPPQPKDEKGPVLEVDAGANKLSPLLKRGLPVTITADEPCEVTVVLKGKVPARSLGRGKPGRAKTKNVELDSVSFGFREAGSRTVKLKARGRAKLSLRSVEGGDDVRCTLTVVATDAAGNVTTVKRSLKLG